MDNNAFKNIISKYSFWILIVLSMCFLELFSFGVSFGSEFKQENINPKTPEQVVGLFCRLDSLGSRLTSEGLEKTFPLVTWKEEAGDVISVIEDYKVGKANQTGNAALVEVEYRILGTTNYYNFSLSPEIKTVVYELIVTNGEWKINKPVTAPHVNWKEVIRNIEDLQKISPDRSGQLGSIIIAINNAKEEIKK